jgi:hypothetical protein
VTKIGRIRAYWAIASLGRFFIYLITDKSLIIGLPFPFDKLCINFDKKYTLGQFFTDSSGRPDCFQH